MPSRAFWTACLRILAAALGVFLFVRFLLPVQNCCRRLPEKLSCCLL